MNCSKRTGIVQVVKAVGVYLRPAAPRHRLPHSVRHINTTTALAQNGGKFSRFPVPSLAQLPEDLQEQQNLLIEQVGFVPNAISAWAYRPDELKAFLHYHDIVMQERGNLTSADKEMIVVATSGENRCLYCIVNRGAMLRRYSKNPYLADQLSVNWRKAEIDDRQRAILEFASSICNVRPLTQGLFDALEKQGLTRDDAWDIGAVVALFALSNRMAYLMDLKPNHEFYSMGRDQSQST